MDRFDAMRVFTRIVERRSFTAAAEDLGMPRATVTHTLQQLEGRLGTRLLNRTTRHVSPTLDGEAFYQRCLRLLADVEEAEGAFRATDPKGLLRVDVHGTLARRYLFPALPDLLARHPGLDLSISEGDRLVDLVREGVDCVLRVGEPRDSALIGRRVALLPQATVASPAYLERFGTPATLDELEGHQAVNFVSSSTGRPYPFEFTVGEETRRLTLPGRVSVTGADSFTAAARLGLGLIQVPRYHLAADLAAGTMVEVLPLHPPPALPVSVLYPHNRQLSPRVRVFVDWVAALFRA
ncbi:LysR family transcriptional regulator [Nitrospirillum sp. BR 11828]|uniref:LysR family transcriptional regulator n=1 Tax=Nitrospirillum sp. BR 11828 TaxID=3104325 RepID=UPI002ACA2981|nr:LysR family transcriptional regulator [Nitrospirillum sp. BR 11828]MDZ5649107.1 LysR family transcriptional regulator [Nitrospirillum sp. BR 11828]